MVESGQSPNYTNNSGVMIGDQNSQQQSIIKEFLENRKINEPFYSMLIALYSFLIIFGSTGNILVVLAVLRNKQMQTAR